MVLGRPPRGGRLREVAPVGGVEVRTRPRAFSQTLTSGFSTEPSSECRPSGVPRRKHAGSLEALRVTRPEAVGLERTNTPNGKPDMDRWQKRICPDCADCRDVPMRLRRRKTTTKPKGMGTPALPVFVPGLLSARMPVRLRGMTSRSGFRPATSPTADSGLSAALLPEA